MQQVEGAKAPGRSGLAEAVAKNLYKLMAYKDEYEVARLFADGAFQAQVNAAFEGDLKFEFHLAPPCSQGGPATGEARKMRFGPWMMKPSARWPSSGLRGTALDLFGYTAERRTERKLITDYEALLETLLRDLTRDKPCGGGGAGLDPGEDPRLRPCEAAPLEAAKAEEADLLARFKAPPESPAQAAE